MLLGSPYYNSAMRVRAMLGAGYGLLCLCPAARAQEAAPAVAGLEEVVVTAQRRAESLSKVPVAVSAFNADQLSQRSMTTETDLQFAVPGLMVKTGEVANALSSSIRGQTLDVA